MALDPPTVFVMLVAATATSMLLMIWGWLQNRRERSLLWIAGGYAAAAVASVLVAARGVLPDFVSIDIANALAIYGVALTYGGLRSFNGRKARVGIGVLAVIGWIAACRIPEVYESYALRSAVSGFLTFTLLGLCLVEALSGRDGLRSRIPLAGLFALHCLAVLIRVGVALEGAGNGDIVAAFRHPAFGWLSIEAAVFAQAIALTVLAMAKERIARGLVSAALTDPLTGLPNRRAFFDAARSILAQAERHRRPTSLVLFDLDRFKQINDTFGHPAGDRVIQIFADALREDLRAGDVAGRVGGEEFAVIMPDTDASQARIAVDRIMGTIAAASGREASDIGGFTTSAGVASSGQGLLGLEGLLVQADAALYDAKRRGGNRVQTRAPLGQEREAADAGRPKDLVASPSIASLDPQLTSGGFERGSLPPPDRTLRSATAPPRG